MRLVWSLTSLKTSIKTEYCSSLTEHLSHLKIFLQLQVRKVILPNLFALEQQVVCLYEELWTVGIAIFV